MSGLSSACLVSRDKRSTTRVRTMARRQAGAMSLRTPVRPIDGALTAVQRGAGAGEAGNGDRGFPAALPRREEA
jgi:hypothetical protein